MLAPRFDVVHLESGELEVGDGHGQVIECAAGKDVADDPAHGGALSAPEALIFPRAYRDRMMEVEPARLEQTVDGLEIGCMVGKADVLEHADRGDLVEAALHARIIAQLE